MSSNERRKYEHEAMELGFIWGKKKANLSRYIRWILENGNRPLSRTSYDQLIEINMNLNRLGGLFNQYVYHLNRELKIINDQGLYDENNRKLISDIEAKENQFQELGNCIEKMSIIMHDICKKEGA